MSKKRPLRTKKYKLSLIDQKAFVIIRLGDGKQSEVYHGAIGDIAYECFEDSFDRKPEVFDDFCAQELN